MRHYVRFEGWILLWFWWSQGNVLRQKRARIWKQHCTSTKCNLPNPTSHSHFPISSSSSLQNSPKYGWVWGIDSVLILIITKQQSTSKTCSYSKASGQHCTSTMCKVNMTCRYNESRHSKCDHTPVKRRRTSTARAVLVAPSNVVLRQRAFTKSLSNAVLRRRARFW